MVPVGWLKIEPNTSSLMYVDRATFNVESETEDWFSGFPNLNILFSKIVSEQPRNPLVSTPVRLVTAVDNIVYLSVLYITSLSLSVLKFILKNKLAGLHL